MVTVAMDYKLTMVTMAMNYKLTMVTVVMDYKYKVIEVKVVQIMFLRSFTKIPHFIMILQKHSCHGQFLFLIGLILLHIYTIKFDKNIQLVSAAI
jgi:hypothetical protein